MYMLKRITCIGLFFMISCSSDKSVRNFDNLKNIHLGMTYDEVIEIMGKPDMNKTIEHDSTQFALSYDAVFGSSDSYYIFLTRQDSLVVAIGDGL